MWKPAASAVLSGNRNFEGRIHAAIKANYLASPPLVVAYALAGTTDKDLTTEPIGNGADGQPVFLKDIWPDGGGGRGDDFEEEHHAGDVREDLRQCVPGTTGVAVDFRCLRG